MPWFHATYRGNLDGIRKNGLGGAGAKPNWPGAKPGVYLASEPELCLFVMIEGYIEFGDPDSVPSEHLKEIVLIVVDDARIDASKLGPDPMIDREDVRLYSGVIDVTGMPVLSVEDIMPATESEPPPISR